MVQFPQNLGRDTDGCSDRSYPLNDALVDLLYDSRLRLETSPHLVHTGLMESPLLEPSLQIGVLLSN